MIVVVEVNEKLRVQGSSCIAGVMLEMVYHVVMVMI